MIRTRLPAARRSARISIEQLEDRSVPAAMTFVNDNWNLVTDTDNNNALSVGDEIRNDNDAINRGGVTAFYGQNGFGVVTTSADPDVVPAALATADNINDAIANTNVGGTVNVLTGIYSENVSIDKNLSLLAPDGRTATTIQGVSGVGALGTVVVTNNTSAVTLGGSGSGFTIVGVDNGDPGIENAALYFQGGHTGARVIGNEIRANGDHGLTTEFGLALSDFVINGNVFSGQTFTGGAPATGNQFTVPNVARQLVVIGNGGGNLATATATNITFTNNQITGTAGAGGAGNSLVTLDVANSTITGNTFDGNTDGFGAALRVRRPGTVISGNTFDSAGMGAGTEHLFLQNNTTPLQSIVTANTFDRGAYVNDTGDLSVSLNGGAGRAASGATLNILSGSYAESLDLAVTGLNKALTLSVGSGPGQATITGNLTLDGNDTLAADINGSAPGTGYDRLIVNGTVALNGATSLATGTRTANGGDVLVLIQNDGADGVTGTFQGRPEGSTVVVNGVSYRLTYTYNAEAATFGNGNDVALVDLTATVVVPPSGTPGATAGGTTTTPAARPAITNATVVNGLLMMFGPSSEVVLAVPVDPRTLVFFRDFTGDGNGDVLMISPGLSFLMDGFTGRFLAIATDLNGDRFVDILLFSPTTGALQTLVFGGTGQRFSFSG